MTMDWQTLFNIATSIILSVTGGAMGYILSQFRREFDRIDKRIDEVKAAAVISARDSRTDHISCQKALPQLYVPRREYEANHASIKNDLGEIKSSIREIYEILRNIK